MLFLTRDLIGESKGRPHAVGVVKKDSTSNEVMSFFVTNLTENIIIYSSKHGE